MNRAELRRRLQQETRLHLDSGVRGSHLAAIEAAEPSNRPDQAAVPTRRRLTRRVALIAATASALAIPTAALAQNALPGDLLYPVKLAAEPVQAIFDEDVRANHRADELAELIAKGSAAQEIEKARGRLAAQAGVCERRPDGRACERLTELLDTRPTHPQGGAPGQTGDDPSQDAPGQQDRERPQGGPPGQVGKPDDAPEGAPAT